MLYGYLAAVAPSLELVTGIVIAPQRQTALLAKQAVQVDLLTGGQFRLGVGQGWNPVEYEALGMSFRDRGRRLEEQMELLRRLWTEPLVDFQGTYHTVTAAGLNPLPTRPIPIWIGGSSETALRRAARIGDGFFPQNPLERRLGAHARAHASVAGGGRRRPGGLRHRGPPQRRHGHAGRLARRRRGMAAARARRISAS